MTTSRLLTGSVWHDRRGSHAHRFRYRMWWADLDLDSIDQTVASSRILSTRPSAPLQFRRSDYLGDPRVPLADAVRDLVEDRTGDRPSGSIRLLAHLRTWWWCFNPIALYLCHDADGHLVRVVADVTNTPWKERHQYVLPATTAGVAGHEEAKALHVSPFMPMDQRYRFDLDDDALGLRLTVTTVDGDTEPFAAGVELRASRLDDIGLLRALVTHPLLTLRVSTGIHTQALRLWWRNNPVHRHPDRQGPQEVLT
ncbi:MAG: DUF1365 domain-containing protein [Acidimicrobiales bacterium]